jgi:type VI secretion system protein ImpG
MKEFIEYYQEQLLFLRKHGGYFAKKHPEIAQAIDLKDSASSDPHTERIIESVAFMAARLAKKIENNEEKLAKHILKVLYPAVCNTFPACCLVCFEPPKQKDAADLVVIPRRSLFSLRQIDGNYCFFKNVYSINLYPLEISSISVLENNNACFFEITIQTLSVPIENMNIDELTLCIDSVVIEDSLLVYEAIFAKKKDVCIKILNKKTNQEQKIVLPAGSLARKGFSDEDAIYPMDVYTVGAYQLFQEMMFFPQKFLFFEVKNIGQSIQSCNIQDIETFTIVIESSLPKTKINKIILRDIFKLNIAPMVNLFDVTSDPFKFDNTKTKYLLIADQKRDKELEIHSIKELHIIDSVNFEDSIICPYFSLEDNLDKNTIRTLFWIEDKEVSEIRHHEGSDTYVSIIDTDIDVTKGYDEVIYAKTLCINRSLEKDFHIGDELIAEGVDTGEYISRLYNHPTFPQPFTDTDANFELVSALACSHISLAEPKQLKDHIGKLLRTLSGNRASKYENFLRNIGRIKTQHVVRRFGRDSWRGFVKGLEFQIFIENEESYYVFFLSLFINEYLSSIVSINSFVEIVLISQKTNKERARLPMSSGRKEII